MLFFSSLPPVRVSLVPLLAHALGGPGAPVGVAPGIDTTGAEQAGIEHALREGIPFISLRAGADGLVAPGLTPGIPGTWREITGARVLLASHPGVAAKARRAPAFIVGA